ncbi:hypothetical protein FCL40_13325 [Ferrimonas sediminicola]|uniref:Uncharacterized protein n=1 Tax=Ferrimonas sediminicola TaxID=2569538 RepID=A0A4U1BCD3_9GAMM|nr:hypothetical protein [Ferrimonas sediminicola]TKB48326.1 hypothetical protein FCL40_13325 [Ferrimonas sediminicola]
MKSTLLTAAVIVAGIAGAGAVMINQGQATSPELSAADQQQWAGLVQCAAYYQIASDAISGMNAPQMQAVGQRLQQSALTAEERAAALGGAEPAKAAIAQAREEQLATLPDPGSLGPLMVKYKSRCQSLMQG